LLTSSGNKTTKITAM